MDVACKVLADKLNANVKFSDPQGGYFIWLDFPPTFNSAAFNRKLQDQYKVCVIPGCRFSFSGQYKNCLRICVVFHEPAVVEKGMTQLCLAIEDWLKTESAK